MNVEPYPGTGPKIPISTEGGYNPLWSKKGNELYYRIDDKVMGVTIETKPDFKILESKDLFTSHACTVKCMTLRLTADF